MNRSYKFLATEKILAFIAFSFILGSLSILIITGTAMNYEISIYSAYPLYLWPLLITGITLGNAIIIRQAFSEKQSNWWLIGFAFSLLGMSIILSLPLFRGYFSYDPNDTAGTLTYSRDIQVTGRVWREDFYPILHILINVLSMLINVPLNIVAQFFPALSTSLFILGIYLLTNALQLKQRQRLLAVALAIPPFFGEQVVVSPRVLAFVLLPYILFYYIKSGDTLKPYLFIPMFLMLTTLVLLHPINGGPLLILILAVMSIGVSIYKRQQKLGNNRTASLFTNLKYVIILTVLIWFSWYTQFLFFENFTRNLITPQEWLGSQITQLMSWVRPLTLNDMIILYLKLHAHNSLYILLGLLATIYMVKKRPHHSSNGVGLVLLLIPIIILFSILTIVALFSPIRVEYWRILPYVIMPTMILNAWLIGATSARLKRIALYGAITITVVGLVIGTFNIYPSPWIKGGNAQITYALIFGLSWFHSHQNDALPIDPVAMGIDRVTGSLTGYSMLPQNIWQTQGKIVPLHFGYNIHSSYGELYAEDHYVTLPSLAYVYYTKRIPEYPLVWRWTPEDLEKLHDDPAASLIYVNGGFEVFYLTGLAKNVSRVESD